jgi:hypothetical protein
MPNTTRPWAKRATISLTRAQAVEILAALAVREMCAGSRAARRYASETFRRVYAKFPMAKWDREARRAD